jgi:cytochrome d ubiquinol oxidase subunit II
MALFFLAGYGETAFYPSSSDLQSSLTLAAASSSHFTLKTMMFVSFFIPLVVGYIWFAWRAISHSRINADEMNAEEHLY